jgi:hypothetical protein
VDVFFSPAADQSTVEPPPIIEYRDVPSIIPIEGLIVLGGVLFMGWTFVKGRRERF